MSDQRVLLVRLPCNPIFPIGPIYLADHLHKQFPGLPQRILDLAAVPLLELLRVDARIRPVAERLLATTFVVDSLARALELSRGELAGCRIATRNGVLVDERGRVIANAAARSHAAAGGFLTERGVASYAYDQRGFGGAPDHGMWPGTETLVADLGTAVKVIRKRHPGIPLFLLGESMGGAVILVAMAGTDPPDVDGVILSAPAVWGRSTMPWYQTGRWWFATHTMPWLK